MNLIPLRSVEFWREVRGPGPKNQSDVTGTFVTHKTKPGDTMPTATGLSILWDRDARAVYLVLPGDKHDPCVIYAWENVRRAIPDTYDWIREAPPKVK